MGEVKAALTTHCMKWPYAILCVLDNIVPHDEVPDSGDPEYGISNALESKRGFGWVCRLHDKALTSETLKG